MRFMRGLETGLGLVGLGYGIYCLSRGRRDWVTASMITSGLSMTISGMMPVRNRRLARQVSQMIGTMAGARQPGGHLLKITPEFVEDVGNMAAQAIR